MKTLCSVFLILTVFFCFSAASAQQTDLEKGIGYYKSGDFKTALTVLKKVVLEEPAPANAWYYLGLAQMKNRKFRDAETSLLKATSVDSKNASAHLALSYVYLFRKEYKKAADSATEVVSLDPRNAEAHYVLGLTASSNDDFEAAKGQASQAIELDPKLAMAYLLKAESALGMISSPSAPNPRLPGLHAKLLTEASGALDQYLKMVPADDDTARLRLSNESVKFFAEYYSRKASQSPDGDNSTALDQSTRTSIKITNKPRASYTDQARAARVSGTIRLLVGFGANGKVEHVIVLKSLPDGLEQETIRAARAITFEPATENGKPVSDVRMIEYTFETR